MVDGHEATLSSRNPRIAHLRRLSGRRRARSEHGQFVVEGPTLVLEALARSDGTGATRFGQVDSVYIDRDADRSDRLDVLCRAASDAEVDVFWLEPGVLGQAADTVTPQPVLAVVNGSPIGADDWFASAPAGFVLVVAGLSDPGNAGTLVRSGEACGAVAVLFTGDAVDPLAPKTVRSSAGSVLRVPIVAGRSLHDDLARLRSLGFRSVATTMHAPVRYTAADLTGDVALVVGNEAHGIDATVLDVVDLQLSIPMQGAVESLNAGVAGSLVAFEVARQRSAPAPGPAREKDR